MLKKQPNEEWGDANWLSESPNIKKFETLAQVSMREENHEKIGELLDYSNQLLINQDENFFECACGGQYWWKYIGPHSDKENRGIWK